MSSAQLRTTLAARQARADLAGCDQDRALMVVEQSLDDVDTIHQAIPKITILIGSAHLLWPYHRYHARALFSKAYEAAAQHFHEKGYEFLGGERAEIIQRPDQRFIVIQAIARRDPAWARRLAELAAEESKRDAENGTTPVAYGDTIADRLVGLAMSLLPVDRSLAITFVRKSFAYPASYNLPVFLYKLAESDQSVADQLYVEGLSQYQNKQITDLSYMAVYAFALKYALGPVARSPYYTVPQSFLSSPVLQQMFLKVLFRRVETAIGAQELSSANPYSTPSHLLPDAAQIYIALGKLEALLTQYQPTYLTQIATARTALGASLSSDLRSRADYLLRQCVEFEEDDSVFDRFAERAEREADSGRQDAFIALAVLNAPETTGSDQLFQLAERINDLQVRHQLANWLYFKYARKAIKKGLLDDAASFAEKIDQLPYRAYISFEIAATAIKQLDTLRAQEALDRTIAILSKTQNTSEKARALLGITHLIARLDDLQAFEVMAQAVETINKTKDADLTNTTLTYHIEGPKFTHDIRYEAPYTLESVFRELARSDFERSLFLANSLEDKFLRALSTIAVCAPCLETRQNRDAQQPQQEPPIRLKTDLVAIDAVVTDKKNRPVSDLKQDDFLVFENGKPQDISFFSVVKSMATRNPAGAATAVLPAQPPRPDSLEPEPGRFIFLILDRYHINPDSLPRLKQCLVRFLTEDISPQDRLAIVSTSGRQAVFPQPAKNAKLLIKVINSFLASGSAYKAEEASDEALQRAQRDMGIPPSQTPKLAEQTRVLHVLKSIERIAESVREIPGRKIAIFVSEKLPFHLSDKYLAPDTYNSNKSEPFENFSHELERIISSSRLGSLAFYTLDPRGLATTIPAGSAADDNPSLLGALGGSSRTAEASNPSAARADLDKLEHSRQGMRELATATGGFTIFDHNNLNIGLRRVLADNESYYQLAYYPSNQVHDGGFRRLTILVKRSGLIVRARAGYIATDDKSVGSKTVQKQERINQALAAPVLLRDVRLSIQTRPGKDPQTGEPLAQLTIQIDPKSLRLRAEGDKRSASLEVIVFAYSLSGKLVNGLSKTLNLVLTPETYTKVLSAGLNMTSTVGVKKHGIYNIRVVVLNLETGEIGTTSDWLEAQ
jgi:VWFA-related protein